MISSKIVFPIIELTDWVYEGERIIEVEDKWTKLHYIKEKDFEKHHHRIIIDSKGQILKVTGDKIIDKKDTLFSFIFPPTLVVEFNLELTNRIMTIEEVKRKIVSKSSKNFDITHNKLMTETQYNSNVNAAKSFEELFKVAGFVDEN